MKAKLLKFVQFAVLAVAVFSAATPSQVGGFQPECPEQLKKFNK